MTQPMEKYDGWIVKNKWGSLLMWTIGGTKREVKYNIDHCDWKLQKTFKIIKVKLVEVE